MRVLWLLFFWPAPALAHHVVTDFGVARIAPASQATVEVQAGSFTLARSGTWQAVAIGGEYAPLPWISLSARLPFARVKYADGSTEVGLADLELAARARLFTTEHGGFMLSAGSGLELPTGDDANGIGAGHLELSPFIAISSTLRQELVFYGIVSALISAGESDHAHAAGASAAHLHGSVLAPHHSRELVVRLGGAYLREPAFLSAGLDLGVPLGAEAPSAFAAARVELGLRLREDLRLLAGVELPASGEARFDYRGRLELAWRP